MKRGGRNGLKEFVAMREGAAMEGQGGAIGSAEAALSPLALRAEQLVERAAERRAAIARNEDQWTSVCALAFETGARQGEVANAAWCEFDLPSRTWTIPKERAKYKRARLVPLTNAALRILASLTTDGPDPKARVFDTRPKDCPERVFRLAMGRLQLDCRNFTQLRRQAKDRFKAALIAAGLSERAACRVVE